MQISINAEFTREFPLRTFASDCHVKTFEIVQLMFAIHITKLLTCMISSFSVLNTTYHFLKSHDYKHFINSLADILYISNLLFWKKNNNSTPFRWQNMDVAISVHNHETVLKWNACNYLEYLFCCSKKRMANQHDKMSGLNH